MATIDFICPLGCNSADFMEHLMFWANKMSSGNHEIRWKCVKSVGCDRIPKDTVCVGSAPDFKINTLNHAAALDIAARSVDADIGIVTLIKKNK